ncbi:MAG: aspartate/glutamate racemase family protein [FCB group bacterium]|nr:aspartate/glutamate racemase family protein [FCB group bacterium]MBL7029293.1 aspartate/glutamate racemase family protein [Candidatus Neomarinimicrobiota bacterium]MBL7121844.1 aspartate/glutamate racemase family protein [Candidatus Neomarinimicrobiota bacterium]
MRWMITDSGLGGLSVCAGLEHSLSQKNLGQGMELLYVNATPDDRIGYNSLKTQKERIDLFDQFLKAAFNRYSPDKIAIACNTLSVIYDATDFASKATVEVKGIVDAGVTLVNAGMEKYPDHKLIIFATETTTEAGTYPRLISADESAISAQECPELAHAISNDASGQGCRNLLNGYVDEALERFDEKPENVFAFLGCTHYGYQTEVFKSLLEDRGCSTGILNPNDLLIEQLVSNSETTNSAVDTPLSIKFVSRYAIPQAEIESMESYLKDTAPLTLAALHNQIVVPDLFNLQ